MSFNKLPSHSALLWGGVLLKVSSIWQFTPIYQFWTQGSDRGVLWAEETSVVAKQWGKVWRTLANMDVYKS